MEDLIKMWKERQLHYEDLAEKYKDSEHNSKKFKYKAMATRDCWKDLTSWEEIGSWYNKPTFLKPEFPLTRVIREGATSFCENCNSTMSRCGFLRLFGRKYCDNKNCPKSKK